MIVIYKLNKILSRAVTATFHLNKDDQLDIHSFRRHCQYVVTYPLLQQRYNFQRLRKRRQFLTYFIHSGNAPW